MLVLVGEPYYVDVDTILKLPLPHYNGLLEAATKIANERKAARQKQENKNKSSSSSPSLHRRRR